MSLDLDKQIIDFLPDTVTVEPVSTNLDRFGMKVYDGESRQVKAYVTGTDESLSLGTTEITGSFPVKIILADLDIKIQDTILLGDGRRVLVQSLEKNVEVPGLEHSTVICA